MAENFTLIISTPEKEFFSGETDSLIITTTEGEMGVLARHELMVVALDVAPVRFKVGEDWREAAVSGGFAQIKAEHVLILADTAEWPEDIEINRALEAKTRAEERIVRRASEIEFLRSQAALRRALTRLMVGGKK